VLLALRAWSDGRPDRPDAPLRQRLVPAWLEGLAPAGTRATVIDRLEYRRR
jgi:hypothetical protein